MTLHARMTAPTPEAMTGQMIAIGITGARMMTTTATMTERRPQAADNASGA